MNKRDTEACKHCTKCGASKSVSEFYSDKTRSDGLFPQCKICHKVGIKAYSQTGRGKQVHREARKKYRKTKKGIESQNRYECSEKFKATKNEYLNRDDVKQQRKEQGKRYRQSEKGKAFYRQYYRKNKLLHCMRNNVRDSLNGRRKGTWTSLVGYSLAKLKNHLEKQFTGGMTWENYGEWHVDHKIPMSAFNFTKPEHDDFKRCWSLINLQPMWASENISKGAKLDAHFQPGLLI